MALPTTIRTALDTLWDELQSSEDKDIAITRCIVGQRVYKLRLTKLTVRDNNDLAYKLEIIRKN